MTADVETISGPTPARQSQKEATRQRVVNAARELFDTHGYQGTTVREIARHAGVAVGSVFTTFASKGEILSQVMQARIDPLYAELDRVMPHLHGSTLDRLRTMFAVHIAFEARHMRLFLSHIAAAYDWTLSPVARPYGADRRLMNVVRGCVEKGVEDGELRADLDVADVVTLLMAAYAWTYRLAITSNADAKGLIAAMDRQLALIAEGLKPTA